MVAVLIDRLFRYAHADLTEAERRSEIRERFVTAYMASENSGAANTFQVA